MWWDKSANEGCIASEGGRRFKCTYDQVQAEKPCWAFLEKDQMVEFQQGKDRFGHDTCFYVTGPGGTLIRQITTLDQARGAGAVPPARGGGGGGGSRFLRRRGGW